MRRRDFVASLTATVWPLAARTQQQKTVPVVGSLALSSPGPSSPYVAAVRQGLAETGYVEGRNLSFEYRWAEGHYDRLPALAADLVARKVDVITAGGGPPARAAKSATSSIPIVFASGDDPVTGGLVASLAHPGANLTGVSILNAELNPKRLELLSALVPQAKLLAFLVNADNTQTERMTREVQAAAHAKGIQLQVLKASDEIELDNAFEAMLQQQVGGVVMNADPFFNSRRQQIVELATRDRVPAIYPWPDFASSGGLIAYGTSLTGVYRQVGIFAGRILNGAKPADLPVEQPTKFELVINIRTAKTLGLTVPQSLLTSVDEVIE